MSQYKILCDKFVQEVQDMGATFHVRDGVVEVVKMGVDAGFDDILWKAKMAVYSLGGHSWGTDGIGYDANKSRGMVSVLCSPTRKSICKYLAEKEGA